MFGFINHKVKDLNDFVKCHLCHGYLIDATTIIECMHSFCKTCIMKHLEDSNVCPKCDCQLHETKPYIDVKTDKVLQSIVYQLFPSVFKDEMKRRRDFHANIKSIKSEICHLSPEKRGEVPGDAYSGLEDDLISVELVMRSDLSSTEDSRDTPPIYILCPSILTIAQIRKFLSEKYQLTTDTELRLFCVPNDELDGKYSLMDILCTYHWDKRRPVAIYYFLISLRTRPFNRSSVTQSHTQSHTRGDSIVNISRTIDDRNFFFVSRNNNHRRQQSSGPVDNERRDLTNGNSNNSNNAKPYFIKNRLRSTGLKSNVSKSMKII